MHLQNRKQEIRKSFHLMTSLKSDHYFSLQVHTLTCFTH